MKKRILLNFMLLLVLLPSLLTAQDAVSNIIAATNKFATDYPQEKVHLHFDKQYYAAGDTIWYKSYVVTAANGLPTNISTSLNLNLVNEKDSLVFSKKIQLFFGMGAGMIALPFSLKKGKYAIYAYTPWMQNFEKDFFFKKTISIENTFAIAAKEGDRKNTRLAQLSFFPEGGDLVADIRSKVAFKYIDVNGLGKNIKGRIIDVKGDVVTSFESAHAGMGIFAFVPKLGESYTAVFSEGGSLRKVLLPIVKKEGYVLAANNLDTVNLVVKIGVSPQLVDERELILVAQSNGLVRYAGKIKPQQLITTLIPKSDLPTGITQLTLFSPSQVPLAERLVFIKHNDNLRIDIQADKLSYGKREKVSLNVKADLGSYSLAVTDQTLITSREEDETTILSSLLLSSDLKGYVEKPNYYFGDSEDAAKYLDYLMLTQGWRRFKWNDVLIGGAKPVSYQPEKNISISGRVLTNSGNPLVNTNVRLLSSRGVMFSVDTLTNKDGRFRFDDISFIDSAAFILQAKNKNESRNVRIVLDPEYIPNFKKGILIDENGTIDISNYLASTKERFQDNYFRYSKDRAIMLKEVEIRGEKKKIEGLKHSANLNGAGNADNIITAEMLSSSLDLFDYLGKYVGGVSEVNNRIVFNRNRNSSLSGDPDVKFYIDGMPVEQEFADNLPIDDIEVVEVLKSAAFNTIYGMDGAGGVIVVTTKRGKNTPAKTPGVRSVMVKGFDRVKEFYSPQYSPDLVNSKRDLRSTIYWNPNLVTDKDGEVTVDFFNSDGGGTYKVVVEGINTDGKIGRKVFSYTVNKEGL